MITSEFEGEYDDNSEVRDTDEEVAAALDGALLEEDDDNDQSEDDVTMPTLPVQLLQDLKTRMTSKALETFQ